MKKVMSSILFVFLFIGCETPQIVYKDLELIEQNATIQKKISDMLLDSLEVTSNAQLEAVVQKKVEIQKQYDQIKEALSRLSRYLKVDIKVDLEQIDIYKDIKGLIESMEDKKDE